MPVTLEITDRSGTRDCEVVAERFWLGAARSGCDVEVDLPGVAGRVLEVQGDAHGRLQVRAEPGLPFPIRCATGSIGGRFEPFLDGDVLNLGPALVKLRYVAERTGDAVEAIDPAVLTASPGSPVGAWYGTFMQMSDHLEGLKSSGEMVAAAMAAVLEATGADRVHVELDLDGGGGAFYLSRPDSAQPFRVSRSLIEQVRSAQQVVHVPVAASDPVASSFHSVRSEGISAAVALPVKALGKTLGVVGLGRIGLTLARRAIAFGMQVCAYDPFINAETALDGTIPLLGSVDELMARCDFVSLHVPKTDATTGMLNEAAFNAARPGVRIVNASRGGIIDEPALLAALDSGALGHATLDVFRTEPLPTNDLFWAHPKVTVTPHIASATRPKTSAQVIAENIHRGENGAPFLHLVDRKSGY